MKAEFSELHACSAVSFLLGASYPEAVVRRAAELGIDSIALVALAIGCPLSKVACQRHQGPRREACLAGDGHKELQGSRCGSHR